MAKSMKGLKVKPAYEDLNGVASSDGLEHIKFPNRDASFFEMLLRILSQLDGEGVRQMQLQQEEANRQAFKESLLKQVATNTGSNLYQM